MFDIITFGSATQDLIVRPKKLTSLKYEKDASGGEVCLPLGSKIDLEEILFLSGGGGTNTAATFALQGFRTAFCGVVGNDLSGENILKELEALNIDTSLVQRTDKKITNLSVVMLNNGKDRTILAYRGAAELMNNETIPFKQLKTEWIYLAPLSGLLAESFEEIVRFAKEHEIDIAVNPSLAQLSMPHFTKIAKYIDVLILNQEEASFLTKIPYEQEKEIFEAIDKICDGVVVMTKGGEGVMVSDNEYLYSAKPNPNRKVVDTLGAGDSFASGFLADFIRTKGNVEKAIQLGMANSEGCLSQIGAKTGLLKKGEKFSTVPVEKMQI